MDAYRDTVPHALSPLTAIESTPQFVPRSSPATASTPMTVTDNQLGSTSLVARRVGVDPDRAADLMNELERRGVVDPQVGAAPREVLVAKGSALPPAKPLSEALVTEALLSDPDRTSEPSADRVDAEIDDSQARRSERRTALLEQGVASAAVNARMHADVGQARPARDAIADGPPPRARQGRPNRGANVERSR